MTLEELINELDGCGLVVTDLDIIRETLHDYGFDPDMSLNGYEDDIPADSEGNQQVDISDIISVESILGDIPSPNPIVKQYGRCECYDENCHGLYVNDNFRCDNQAICTLYRIDMTDSTGTDFCEACANDAMESGLYRDEKNSYS